MGSIQRIYCCIILVLAVCTAILPKYFNDWQIHGRNVYFVGQAFSYTFIALIGQIITGNKVTKLFFDVFIWLSINNLYDECLGDPLHLNINEVWFTSFILLWISFRILTWTISKQKC